jgi:hypothetical protein
MLVGRQLWKVVLRGCVVCSGKWLRCELRLRMTEMDGTGVKYGVGSMDRFDARGERHIGAAVGDYG